RHIVTIVSRAIGKGAGCNGLDRRTHHETSPVHEMAEFAHDAAAVSLVLGPMIGWQISGVDPRMHHHGFLTSGKELTQFHRHWRESAIETNHYKGGVSLVSLRFEGAANFFQLLKGHGQRF